MIIVVVLPGKVVDNSVALDVSGGGAILHNDRWAVQVDTVVDHEQRVVVVDDVVVDTDTVEVLLEQVLEEKVLLLEGGLLLLDRKLVKVDLVVALVEVVELLVLVVGVRVNTDNLIDHLVRLLLGIRIGLVERQDLLLLSLELAAQLSCLQDTLTELLVALELLHAVQAVRHKRSQVLFLLTAELRHLLLQVVIVPDDGVFLASKSLVAIVLLALDLSSFKGQLLSLPLGAIDGLAHPVDCLSSLLVGIQHLGVLLSLGLGLVHVLLELDLESVIQEVDLLDQIHLHSLSFLDVLVTSLLLLGKEVVLDQSHLLGLLLMDSLDHLLELLGLGVMRAGNVGFLAIVLLLEDTHIALKLFMKTTHARLLQSDEVINMDQVVSESHLVLLLGLIEISIKHLQDSVLGIDLTIVVLLEDLNLLLERFSFREAEPLTPLGQNLHAIEMAEALLLNHLRPQIVSPLAHELLLPFKVLVGLLLVADANHLASSFLALDASLDELAKLNH